MDESQYKAAFEKAAFQNEQLQKRIVELDKLNQALSNRCGMNERKIADLMRGSENSKSLPQGFEMLDGITHAIFGNADVRVSDVYWSDEKGDVTHTGVSFSPADRKGNVGDTWNNEPGLCLTDINALFAVKASNIESLHVLKGSVERAIERLNIARLRKGE